MSPRLLSFVPFVHTFCMFVNDTYVHISLFVNIVNVLFLSTEQRETVGTWLRPATQCCTMFNYRQRLAYIKELQGGWAPSEHSQLPQSKPGGSIPLTLIGPGEVKVDLADFDLKLQENN